MSTDFKGTNKAKSNYFVILSTMSCLGETVGSWIFVFLDIDIKTYADVTKPGKEKEHRDMLLMKRAEYNTANKVTCYQSHYIFL